VQTLPRDITNEERLDRLMKLPRVRKYLARKISLNRTHHIPFLGGYSVDGATIYIDCRMPRSFEFKGRAIYTDRFLILHEHIEKALLDALGWVYLAAHRIAIVAERRAVEAAGVDWADYDAFLQGEIARIKSAPFSNVPVDLDLEPYRGYPKLIAEIRGAQNKGRRRLATPSIAVPA
jgi:hypothetical protein